MPHKRYLESEKTISLLALVASTAFLTKRF